MDGTYEIMLGGEPVGQAVVRRQGLYYRFSCRCDLSGEVIYRITVTCGGKSESLGIPVPKNGEFYLDTRLAASRLGEGEPKFAAVPRRPDLGGMFVPISPEEPFRYLHRLENAFLARKDGQLGIVIRE
jgi:hypothetical protein